MSTTSDPVETNEENKQNGVSSEHRNLDQTQEIKPAATDNPNLEVKENNPGEDKSFGKLKQNFVVETNTKLLEELKKELNSDQLLVVENIVNNLDNTGEGDTVMSAKRREAKYSRGSSPKRFTQNETMLPTELQGQPSVEDKDWKSREVELLNKISLLERKMAESPRGVVNYEGPLDPVAFQMQQQLETDLSTRTKEKEDYRKRLLLIENELLLKEKEKEMGGVEEIVIGKTTEEVINILKIQNEDLRSALTKMTALLRDKTGLCTSQEKKMSALSDQVESLKEVVAITKDLLNIRNMEVQHLTTDICKMEGKIDAERERHNLMIIKMDEAVKLNGQLKKEYETQLKLFQELRERYEEKMNLMNNLSHQDNCLRDLINSVTDGPNSRKSTSPAPH